MSYNVGVVRLLQLPKELVTFIVESNFGSSPPTAKRKGKLERERELLLSLQLLSADAALQSCGQTSVLCRKRRFVFVRSPEFGQQVYNTLFLLSLLLLVLLLLLPLRHRTRKDTRFSTRRTHVCL